MRIAALDDLAVHLDDQAQHAVGRRMLRPEVHRQVLISTSDMHAQLLCLLRCGLLVAGQHLLRAFPRAQEVEAAELLVSFTGS